LERAAQADIVVVREAFHQRLAQEASAGLRAVSDTTIDQMRATFDPALEHIQQAANCGLTPATDTQTLADSADADTITAYRQIPTAVTVLDRLARLRTTMATVAGIGSTDYPMANLLAAHPVPDLDSAQSVWQGEIETVQYELPSRGSQSARVPRPRLGGP
jgi:hypothetical protein